jgi:hypothetical protein
MDAPYTFTHKGVRKLPCYKIQWIFQDILFCKYHMEQRIGNELLNDNNVVIVACYVSLSLSGCVVGMVIGC